jgi:AcrR family transcriptional regulator
MSPRKKEQFENLRRIKRRQILLAGTECFAAHGYHAVTISDLAGHASISKGLMYNYFESKEDLLKTIFREVMAEMMELFNPENKADIDRDMLLNYLNRLFARLKSDLTLWKMYIAIFSQPAVLQILDEEIKASATQPLELIWRYFKSRGSKDPAFEVAFLSTLTSGAIYEYIADPVHYPLEKIRERICSFY